MKHKTNRILSENRSGETFTISKKWLNEISAPSIACIKQITKACEKSHTGRNCTDNIFSILLHINHDHSAKIAIFSSWHHPLLTKN